ncbi:MAG: DEAD/DEAH box helicase family protein [Bacteroidales bacterium]|nr:DEAD/DEAH box helicase family protein [Bacteroidales bacterium]
MLFGITCYNLPKAIGGNILPKFLAKLVNVDDLKKYGNRICLVAGVGAGKNHWVENELARNNDVLLITSRRAITDQVDNRDNEFIANNLLPIYRRNCTVMTHAMLAKKIKESPELDEVFDYGFNFSYLVIDEAHSIVCDSTFTDSAFLLWAFINYGYINRVILMSATIAPLKDELNKGKWKILDLTRDCVNIKPNQIKIILKNQAINLLKTTNSSNKALYMGTSAKGLAKTFLNELEQRGISRDQVSLIMSDERTNELLDPRQIEQSNICYKRIIKENKLPDDINILLATSKLKEGVNIKDENVKMIFIESHYSIDIIQFIGRMRLGVDTVYIIDDARQNHNIFKQCDYDYSVSKEVNSANSYLQDLITKLHDKDLFREFSSSWNKNYYTVSKIKEFVDYIEERFQFIRFNPFSQRFEIYTQRYAGFVQHEKDLEKYNNNKVDFLRSTTGVEMVINDTKTNQKIVDEYITSHQLLEVPIGEEIRTKMRKELTKFGITGYRNKPYKNLKSLLKPFGYSYKPTGDNNRKEYIISKI